MKANKLAWMLTTAVLAAVLTGCHGQDPFKRESNPIKQYPNAAEVATQAYVPGQKSTATTPAPNGNEVITGGSSTGNEPAPCFEIIKASAEPNHGTLLLKFVENVESTYSITVFAGGPQIVDLDIQAERPDGSTLQLISRQGNTLKYNFTWKPTKGRAKREKFVILNNSPIAEGACPESKKSVEFNLSLGQSKEAPTVSFPDIKEKITFGDKFDFKIVIEDPAATEQKVPDLHSIKYLKSTQKAGLLNASKAVIACDEKGQPMGENKFEFTCSFDSNLIKGIDKILNSGKEADAGFSVTVISTSTGKLSTPVIQSVKVLFAKVAPAQGAKP